MKKSMFEIPLQERELKEWFSGAFSGTFDAVQPSRGSTVGLSDLVIHYLGKTLVPVELKVGTYDPKAHTVRSLRVRPAQIRWHHLFNHRGGHSLFLIGVGFSPLFSIWAVPGSCVRELASGGTVTCRRVKAGAVYHRSGRAKPDALFTQELNEAIDWASRL